MDSSLQRGDRAAGRELPDHLNVKQCAAFYVQDEIRPADSIWQAEPRGIHLNPAARWPENDGCRTHCWTAFLSRNRTLHLQLRHAATDGMEAGSRLQNIVLQGLINQTVAAERLFQGSQPHCFQDVLTSLRPLCRTLCVLPGIAQDVIRALYLTSKLAETQLRVVSKQLLVARQESVYAQRPRIFFAM